MQNLKSNTDISDYKSNELFTEYQDTKDLNIRNKLIENYLYIAEIMAKKFVNKGVEFDDLYQIASLALIKAIDRFDVSKGVKFSTFATPSIIGEIKNYFRDKVRLINPGRKNNQLLLKIKKAISEIFGSTGKTPRAEDIAKYLNVDTEAVIEAMEFNNAVISLDNTLEDNESTLYDIVPDNNNFFEKIDNHEALKKALSNLSKEERDVIEKRYVYNLSQSEIAKEMNVSQMFISRLERKIIKKLKKLFEIA